MEPRTFFDATPKFHALKGPDKVLLVGWFLHVHAGRETFSREDLRACFRKAQLEPPDLSVYLPRMEAKKPPQILKGRGGYRLEGACKRQLDAKYGDAPSTVAVSTLLVKLPVQVPDLAERAFLREALDCYRIKAYRAAIVMTWSLAFDHFCAWIMKDAGRLTAFNSAFKVRFPKKDEVTLRTDFDELKENDIIELSRAAKFLPKNVGAILGEKLRKRNMAAHPSSVVITQAQADDVITDLVNNVVLELT